MANDERQSATFIREVDEELRRDQLKALWNRFGWIFIGICVLIVLITAGNRGWVWWQARQAAQAGDQFMAALQEVDSGDHDKGIADLKAIAESGRAGYAALAQLRLAGQDSEAGDKKAALATYDALAADSKLSQSLRDLAQVRAALLALDTGDNAGAIKRAEPLNESGNPWRHAAREVLGTAAYAEGDLAKARDYFTSIQEDAETPQDMWVRSSMMISLIDSRLAAPDSMPAQPADAGGGTSSDAGSAPEGTPPAAATPETTAPAEGAMSSEPAPAVEAPAEPAPMGSGAMDSAPADTMSSDTAPAASETAPAESMSAEPAASEPMASEPAASEPAPSEPAPADAMPSDTAPADGAMAPADTPPANSMAPADSMAPMDTQPAEAMPEGSAAPDTNSN